MAPKRTKSEMALMASDDVLTEESSTPGRRNGTPRRSGRLRRDDAEPDKSMNSIPMANPKKAKSRAIRKAVMSDLQRMEGELRDDVKRQKIAIRESETKPVALEEDGAPPRPRIIKSQPEVLPIGIKKEGKGENHEFADGEEMDFDGPRALAEGAATLTTKPEEVEDDNDVHVIKQEAARPPPVNSDYLPLPWKGRIGYACLNTYLRTSNPPVFSSRTCRIASILEHRHPLQDPSQPAHPTKNRPDKEQPADIRRGQEFVENLGLANARDIAKMLRWNDKYGIKFMRLSSEMFPFAGHEQYGYELAPFASEVLRDVGKVAAELGHRLTTHPGQYTQLGSPRKEVVSNAVRDLEYHNEMLTLLQLPEQQDKDAVMILHMGGVFGDKAATLDRFRENYGKLSDAIKARLVLENDDVSWTVHDLLPICEELNIPMVLDYHHHNIMFDKDQIREGTKDIMELYPRIKATWDRKGITQKMHYSEPCSDAVTPRQRRKHRPRVMTLPPCADTMDLMIEAKDKEQAVFDLMRTFRLPGWDSFNDVVPYEREDENRPPPKAPKKKPRKKGAAEPEVEAEEPKPPPLVPEEELGMGGPQNRVYWPVGMEEWLHPRKREVKKKRKADDVEE